MISRSSVTYLHVEVCTDHCQCLCHLWSNGIAVSTNTKSNFSDSRRYSSDELMIDPRGTYLPFKQSYLKDTLQVVTNVGVIKQGSLPRSLLLDKSHFEQVKRYWSSYSISSHLPIQ